MIDILSSDAAIALLSAVGLTVTTFSIVRDTRSQREQQAEKIPVEA